MPGPGRSETFSFPSTHKICWHHLTSLFNMNTSDIFPTSLPPGDRWIVADNSFDPSGVWYNKDAACIKKNARRRVIRAGEYFLKFFRTGPPITRKLRDPAWKEYKTACHLHKHGITAPPAAWMYHQGWSCFVSKNVHAADLAYFLENEWHQLDRKNRRHISRHFAGLLINLAEAGFYQPDFHLNNILFDSTNLKFTVIDLHRAKLYNRPLNARQRMRQLTYVLPPFTGILPHRYALECVSTLKHNWMELGNKANRFQVADSAYAQMRLHWSKRALSRLIHNWQIQKVSGAVIISSKKHTRNATSLLNAFHQSPEAVINNNIKILKNSRHTLCILLKQGPDSFFLKAYRSSGHFKSFSYLLRPRKVLTIWERAWRIVCRNLPIMEPLAVLQYNNPWRAFYGALVYHHVPLAEKGEWKKRTLEILKNTTDAQSFLRHLARDLWLMHQKGVFHGDCKISNFVTDERGNIQFFFDTDSAAVKNKITNRQRLKDLVCMAASLEKLLQEQNAALQGSFVSMELFKGYVFCHHPWNFSYKKLAHKFIVSTKNKIEKSEARGKFFSET